MNKASRAGKSGITLDQRTGGVVSCGPFPILWRGRNARYTKRFGLILFSVFCLAGISLFIFAIDFLTCFVTVADRSAMRDRALEEMARN